jgi:hypothetical protein
MQLLMGDSGTVRYILDSAKDRQIPDCLSLGDQEVVLVKLTVITISFFMGMCLGIGIGWIAMPIFIVPFYIILEALTPYSRWDVDPMPIVFWSLILCAITAAVFCSIISARLYKRWSVKQKA